jgi:hypothetical protein
MYTPSHAQLFEQYFLASVPNDVSFKAQYISNDGDGYYKSTGWWRAIIDKIDFIEEIILNEWGSTFIFSDVDVQFFGPISAVVSKSLNGYDVVCQKDSPGGTLCTGFFGARANENNLSAWRYVRMLVQQHWGQLHDQNAFNQAVRRHAVKWAFLPLSFFGGGTFSGKIWNPGANLHVPASPLLHHANYTCGVSNKALQLEYVRNIVTRRS